MSETVQEKLDRLLRNKGYILACAENIRGKLSDNRLIVELDHLIASMNGLTKAAYDAVQDKPLYLAEQCQILANVSEAVDALILQLELQWQRQSLESLMKIVTGIRVAFVELEARGLSLEGLKLEVDCINQEGLEAAPVKSEYIQGKIAVVDRVAKELEKLAHSIQPDNGHGLKS